VRSIRNEFSGEWFHERADKWTNTQRRFMLQL
jgi:hypothetical protein